MNLLGSSPQAGHVHGKLLHQPAGQHLPERGGADLRVRRGEPRAGEGHALLPVLPGGHPAELPRRQGLLPGAQDGPGAGGPERLGEEGWGKT